MAKPDLPPETALLVQIHLAEYTQITTRNTYYMSVSYAFWSVLTLYLALLGTGGWTSLKVSVAAIGCDFIGAGWYFCLMEQYKNVRYIESALKPRLREIMPNQDFWGFETQRHPISENQWARNIGDIWAWVGIFFGSLVASLHMARNETTRMDGFFRESCDRRVSLRAYGTDCERKTKNGSRIVGSGASDSDRAGDSLATYRSAIRVSDRQRE